jgi:hypothetical protein
MVVSKDGGRKFGERLLLSAGINGANHPRIIARKDHVVIAFEGQIEKGRGTQVIYRQVTGDGVVSAPEVIPNTGGSVSYPAIAEDERGLLIAWSETKEENATICLARSE